MCFATPKAPEQPARPVTPLVNQAADQLGLNIPSLRGSSLIGRLGLSVPRKTAPKTSGTPTGDTTTNTPAGTLGLDPYYMRNPAPPEGP